MLVCVAGEGRSRVAEREVGRGSAAEGLHGSGGSGRSWERIERRQRIERDCAERLTTEEERERERDIFRGSWGGGGSVAAHRKGIIEMTLIRVYISYLII